MAESCQEVRRANAEEFLPWIDAIPVLAGKRARRGNAFDVSK
jgi:hypothetical protein